MKPKRAKIFRPVSLRLLTGLILITVVLAYYLLPTHRKLLDRQLQDGKTRQALMTLWGLPASEREKEPAFYAALELRLVRELLDPADSEAVIRQILQASHAYEQFDFADEFLNEILPLITFTREIERVQKLLKPALARMPDKGRQKIFPSLAKAALAANQPTLAPYLYLEFWENSPPLNETTVEMARLWRSAGEAVRALNAIETFVQKTESDPSDLSYPLAKLRIELFRETAQPGKAFDALRELAPSARPDRQAELFDLMVKTALESSRTKEVLPLVKTRAEHAPRNVELWKRLGDLSVSAGEIDMGVAAFEKVADIKPESTEVLLKLGQLCEWSEQPERAFDYYLRALEKRDPSGIERLAALSQGLYRDAELALTLEHLGALVDPRDHPLQFARLYGRVGDFEKAKRLYTDLLSAPDADVELLVEYGTFLHALSEFEPAHAAFKKAAALKPGDPEILTPLAEIQFRLANYEESLKAYGRLLEVTNESDVFEKYFNLAESLGDLDGIIHGLRVKIDREVAVSPYDYERLAVFLNIQGDRAAYYETLEASLRRYPDQENLRETAAYAYSDRGRYRDAVLHLERMADLKANPRLIRFYLSVLVQLNEFAKAEAFLATGIEERVLNLPAILETRAYLYEAAGNIEESSRLYARLHEKSPRQASYALNYGRLLSALGRAKEAKEVIQPFLHEATPEVLRLAAQVSSAVGDYRAAESYQRRFLEAPPRPAERPQAWGYLGDILSVQGDRRRAKQAYQRGVSEMFKMAASAKQ